MKLLYLIIFILILNACSSLRDSAGVSRKSIDEFKVIENPPLVIPPDFNILPPDQLESKNIENLENELAKEILFGLDETEGINQNSSSTIKNILSKVDTSKNSPSIRSEIDKEYSNEVTVKGILEKDWESELEILDAIKESECIRDKNFDGKLISDCKLSTKKEKIIKKKKKRFILF